ncbi:hypothetical protein [Fictibacillus phosphorivorans]|uniref:hypothetical protein n=1 Tax=Fictibacillus phosphorivorans TaxID=1221500 RepID=UPI002040D102|nr:hypothetical protein [Fictibacillus phosphorivorans]MCM3717357.1 hypothetical protein [Fictibacillus phosphorivorans]MCM3775052.1 hypothetical protein [Fictibacillus phosphorivorans]
MKDNVIPFKSKSESLKVNPEQEITLIQEIRELLSEFHCNYPLVTKKAILLRIDQLTDELIFNKR